MIETYYRTHEIAKKLDVHVKTVQGWISRGELEAVKVGRTYRVTEEQLNRYLERNKTN